MARKIKKIKNNIEKVDASVVSVPSPPESLALQRIKDKFDNANQNLSVGVAIPTYRTTSLDSISNIIDFHNKETIYEEMELCLKLHRRENIIGKVVDAFSEFAVSRFRVKNTSDELRKILKFYFKNVNDPRVIGSQKEGKQQIPGIDSFLYQISLEYFTTGNCIVYSTGYDVMLESKKYKLPLEFNLINPLSVEILDSPSGDSFLYYRNNAMLAKLEKRLRDISRGITSSFTDSLMTKAELEKGREALDIKRVTHIKRKAKSYDKWGIPFLIRCFEPIASKKKLRVLDDATVEGLVNSVRIFRIGDKDRESPFHIPPQSRLSAFANLIKNPQASNALVWAHDVDIIEAKPDQSILSFTDKYKTADRDILYALDMPPVFIDGQGDMKSSWFSILAFVERFESVRLAFASFLNKMIMKIIIDNKIEYDINDPPEITFLPINIRDENIVRTLLINMYDRGLLPVETTIEQAGYNFDDMLLLKKSEKKNNMNEIFNRPDIPFSPSGGPGSTKAPTPEGGRPPGNRTEKDSSSNDSSNASFSDSAINISILLFGEVSNFFDILQKTSGRIKVNKELSSLFKKIDDKTDSIISVSGLNERASALVDSWKTKWIQKMLSNAQSLINSFLSDEKTISQDNSELLKDFFNIRLSLFISEFSRNMLLAGDLEEKREQGHAGAFVRIKEEACEKCKKIADNWYSINDLFKILPMHIGQDFNLEFTVDDPRIKGNINKSNVVKTNPPMV